MSEIRNLGRIGIGTATFIAGYGLAASEAPGVTLLRYAIERGVAYLDTAALYGESERAIGELASECAQRGVRICTKVSPEGLQPDSIEQATRASLERLRSSAVDTLMLHSVTGELLRSPAIGRAWDGVRKHALAVRIGASTYGIDDARFALGTEWCDSLQVEHSILNQSVLRAIADVRRTGQEIVVRSVLCKGLLTRGALDLSLPTAVAARVTAIEEIARGWGMTLPSLAIRFALDTPGVNIVVVGVASRKQLDEALSAAALPPLSDGRYRELAAMDASYEDWSHPERWPNGVLVS